jgi:putative hemolysin
MMQINSRPLPSVSVYRRIEPYVSLRIETPRYILKTVDQVSEFQEVLKLRFDVFASEYGMDTAASVFDIDQYDFVCDHLIIIEKETADRAEKVIGTYRMLCSQFTDRFYSETEFKIDEFLQAPGIKLELGRACIRPDHRRGAALSLLWRGIIQYASKTGSQYLFGLSSVKVGSAFGPQSKALYLDLVTQGRVSSEWNIRPIGLFEIPNFVAIEPSEQILEVPALLKSYLNAGAKVYATPAYDPAFHCLDLFTVLNLDQLKSSYERKYQY